MDKKEFILQVSKKIISETEPIKDSLLELFLSKPKKEIIENENNARKCFLL